MVVALHWVLILFPAVLTCLDNFVLHYLQAPLSQVCCNAYFQSSLLST